MRSFTQFILESFLDTVKDEETKKLIQKLLQSGDMLKAYEVFHTSNHKKKKIVWGKKNPKFFPDKWKKMGHE
jgi:hypothetical protein